MMKKKNKYLQILAVIAMAILPLFAVKAYLSPEIPTTGIWWVVYLLGAVYTLGAMVFMFRLFLGTIIKDMPGMSAYQKKRSVPLLVGAFVLGIIHLIWSYGILQSIIGWLS